MKPIHTTEDQPWAGFERLFPGQLMRTGDVRSSKSDYTYREPIPASYAGRFVPDSKDTDFFYFRPLP